MRVSHVPRHLLMGTAALALAACGGGGSGLRTIPMPPATPTPAATPTGALSAPPGGVTGTTSFTTLGDQLTIRWDADAKVYEISVPGGGAGKVVQTFAGEFGASGDLVATDGSKIYSVSAPNAYSYTGEIELFNSNSHLITAFGVPTPVGGVPTTGSATFDAQLNGHAGQWPLYGTALLKFDFGAGTLSGYMDPHTNGPMESPTLPRYTFTQTVFSAGSTTFSGSFDFAGPTPSSFQGQFTGPNAQELMASFKAPFLDWDANENPTVWNVMEGVMIGKRR